jgi:hypothetical protein
MFKAAKMFMASNLFKRALASSAAALVLAGSGGLGAAAQEKKGADEKRQVHTSISTWEHKDNGWRRMVRIEGKVELDEDFSDVAQLSEDSSLRAVEERGGTTRRYFVSLDAAGRLRREYSVNGSARELDGEARAWVREMLNAAVRRGGLYARERARRILRSGGPRALVEELGRLEGDYTVRVYFEELLKAGGLGDDLLADALRRSARVVSDYERAQMLIRLSENFLPKDNLLAAYFESVERIESDYEQRRVLTALVRRGGLGREALLRLIRSTASLQSDYEKATFLLQAARLYADDERLREAFRDAVSTIQSDYERGRVEKAMARRATAN